MYPDQLRGYRLGEHNGVYGPMLPLHIRQQRLIAHFWRGYHQSPDTIIIHPALFQEWVDEGYILPNGEINRNWKDK